MKKIPLLCILLFSFHSTANDTHINQIPDFTQTHVKGYNTGNGQQFCAPVAASNSLIWLSGQTIEQNSLILKLASREYMNTHLKNGTGTSGFLKGIDKISRELFGHYSKLEYQGWRKHPPSFSTGVTIPRLEWIKDSIGRESAVWLNIGWYKYDKDSMSYIRKGGHWVTVVGYNHGKLIIHDPAPRAGQDFSNEYVSVHHLVKGRLIGKKSGLPTSAVGYLSLGEGMHIKGSVGFSVVDGVVRLIL